MTVYVLVLYTENEMFYYCGYSDEDGVAIVTRDFFFSAMYYTEAIAQEANGYLGEAFMVEEHGIEEGPGEAIFFR